jgi:hypothetical protein
MDASLVKRIICSVLGFHQTIRNSVACMAGKGEIYGLLSGNIIALLEK